MADNDADVLARIPFFQGFSPEHLKLIAVSAESRSLPDRLLLYDEGQLLHSAYVIVSGLLTGQRKVPGSDEVETREIGPGVLLGERALILDTRADEAVRVKNRVNVLQIRKVMFRKLLQDNPEIAINMRSRLTRNVMEMAAGFGAVGERLKALEGYDF